MKGLVALIFVLPALSAWVDFTGKVVAVAAGDTVTVLRGREQIKIRLAGIDAPEKKQPFGNVAKERMGDLVFGKEVRVDDRKKDRYAKFASEHLAAAASRIESGRTNNVISLSRLRHGLDRAA